VRSRRRVILAMATSALVLGGAAALPVPTAMALPCVAWSAWNTYDPATDEHVQTPYCTAYANDAPAETRPDRPGDPGAGGGGGSAARPGSPESCSEVADQIAALRAEVERLQRQRDSILFDIALRERDLAASVQTLQTAINRTAVARQASQTAWDEYLAAGGETDIQFDSRGKPIHQNPQVQAAQVRLGVAIANESAARSDAGYAAGRVNASRDQLAAVERAGAIADNALAAAMTRQAAEKCAP